MKKIVTLLLVALLSLSGCASKSTSTGMKAGTYTSTGTGFHGDITLEVTVDDSTIKDIVVKEQSETENIGGTALPKLVEAVLTNQTIGIDTITGATLTSNGFIDAMRDALTQAGADMEKMSAPVEITKVTEEELNTDIIVVGGGAAGLTAALRILQNGKNVIVLEKTGTIGGASAMAGGGTVATGSTWQKEDGMEDSVEKLVEDMMINGHGNNDLATVEIYANSIAEAFDWLVSEDGANVAYKRTGNPVRTYSADGRGSSVVKNLAEQITVKGGTIMMDTAGYELITENGKVVGVKAKSKTTDYTIHANSVILATGGYGANNELVPEEYHEYVYAGAAGATGDAISMVSSLDADLINMQFINTQPNSMILPSGLGQYCNPGVAAAYKNAAFMVNEDGNRFVNETTNAWDIMQAMKENQRQYLIMDQTSFDAFNEGMINAHIYSEEDVQTWLANDGAGNPFMVTSSSIDELAVKLDVSADALKSTVETYNKEASIGKDSYSRELSTPLASDGPYYALQVYIRYYASLGGLHINDQFEVLNKDGEAIEGLYAAGEVVGGLEGDVYMGGTLFGFAVTSGYQAGDIASSK